MNRIHQIEQPLCGKAKQVPKQVECPVDSWSAHVPKAVHLLGAGTQGSAVEMRGERTWLHSKMVKLLQGQKWNKRPRSS